MHWQNIKTIQAAMTGRRVTDIGLGEGAEQNMMHDLAVPWNQVMDRTEGQHNDFYDQPMVKDPDY